MPCRMHSRNLIASRASESGKVRRPQRGCPPSQGTHWLCAVLGPAHSPPHCAAFVFIVGKLKLGKRNFLKSRAGEGGSGRRQRSLLSLHSECFQENPAASAPRLRPHRWPGDERTGLPGVGHTVHRVSTWGINKHICCSLSPTG